MTWNVKPPLVSFTIVRVHNRGALPCHRRLMSSCLSRPDTTQNLRFATSKSSHAWQLGASSRYHLRYRRRLSRAPAGLTTVEGYGRERFCTVWKIDICFRSWQRTTGTTTRTRPHWATNHPVSGRNTLRALKTTRVHSLGWQCSVHRHSQGNGRP